MYCAQERKIALQSKISPVRGRFQYPDISYQLPKLLLFTQETNFWYCLVRSHSLSLLKSLQVSNLTPIHTSQNSLQDIQINEALYKLYSMVPIL